MEVAVGSAASLLGKVWTTLSDGLVAAYVDSLQLGQNSEEIRDKLLHTQGLLHSAQAQLVGDVGDNPGLQGLLEKLSRDADQAEDLLDELHYFQIHDRLHATNHATTQDLDGLRHQALHAGTALRHTLTSLLHCFSCSSSTPKTKSDAAAAAVAGGAPCRVTNTLGTLLHCLSCSSCTPKIKRNGGGGDAVAAVAGVTTNSNSATADDNVDTLLHFDRVSMSRQIKSVLEGMQSHYVWRGSSDLPEDFSHLENLHDFHAESAFHSNIRNVGKMKHLQELKKFHVRKESMGFELAELGALTELEGGLVIRGLEHVVTKEEATAAKLMLKRNLKELQLLWDMDGPTTDGDILDALRPHPNLRALRIADHGGKCFMRLKKVEFHEMPGLAEWVVEPNCCSFPSLEEIICINCANLRVMPLSEVSCTNLRRLEICGCPKMSLPSMPHTSTLTDLNVTRYNPRINFMGGDSVTLLSYDGKKLVVRGYGGALAYHNVDKVEEMDIANVSHISLTDIEKFKSLTELTAGRCDGLFPEELDGSFVLRSVKSLKLDVSHLTSSKSSLSKVLNCFLAVSVLRIFGDGNHDYEERAIQLPSSSSLQELTFWKCKGLVLVSVEKDNGRGIQEDKSLLQSLRIFECGEFLCRWPSSRMGESETICPFPASLRKLDIEGETRMQSMALLSNLTSLTRLRLKRPKLDCCNLSATSNLPACAPLSHEAAGLIAARKRISAFAT
ncbi:hypothetical protein ZWY2020_019589 [Hordeum vulgare]|nr:hypothetical protein ZWY2020_019589 [Hordeum vulgare]